MAEHNVDKSRYSFWIFWCLRNSLFLAIIVTFKFVVSVQIIVSIMRRACSHHITTLSSQRMQRNKHWRSFPCILINIYKSGWAWGTPMVQWLHCWKSSIEKKRQVYVVLSNLHERWLCPCRCPSWCSRHPEPRVGSGLFKKCSNCQKMSRILNDFI